MKNFVVRNIQSTKKADHILKKLSSVIIILRFIHVKVG